MFKIATLNNISQAGLKVLPGERYAISAEEKDPDGIILRSFNMNEMELPTSLKAVARAGAGVNNIPIDRCSDVGVVVFNTPGANANAVKELVIAGLLLSSRKISEGIIWTQTLRGQEGAAKLIEKGKAQFGGPEIMGKKLGVIGLGAIGVLTANAASALGMEVCGFDPFISVKAAWGLSSSVNKAPSMEALIADCDYISLHLPLNDKTKNMFNTDLFKLMKKGARLLNFARAELVEFQSLKAALADGTISCYVTDFPNEDVIGLDNVVTIPHLGASTEESEENCAEMAATELRDYLEKGIIINSVNFPECDMAYAGKPRVVVLHKNEPNMVSALTQILGSRQINVANMVNNSKGAWACTVMDVDDMKNENVMDDIKAVDGVVGVRII